MPDSLVSVAEILVICGSLLATLIYSIWACASDARRRGKSPLLVAVLVIVFFPIGLIIWLLVRPPLSEIPKPFKLGDHRSQ
jgi:hypothetical protein